MKRKRHTPEQVVEHLRQADQLLGEGKTVAQVCRKLGVTEVTYYRWRREYDGASRNQVKRFKEIERENQQLKRLVAEQALELRVLQDVAEGNF